jgi:hypothetical protein
MNNEPVAWMHKTYFPNGLYEEDLVWSKVDESSIPLYTHPAKTEDEGKVCARCGAIAYDPVITQTAKTLTDGEILNMYLEQTNGNRDLDILEFARAILRKAQEK